MLTIEQCRGARGILGWTQQDLADASGLSKTAINNFEKGHSDIKTESLRAIRMAFESADIEFLSSDGLRRKAESVIILKGADAMDQLFEDIRGEVGGEIGGEILIANAGSNLAERISSRVLLEHLELLGKYKIHQRILCPPGERSLLGGGDDCRWIAEDRVKEAFMTVIYGEKVAFELWGGSMIVIVESADAQKAERNRFEYLWGRAQKAGNMGAAAKGGAI